MPKRIIDLVREKEAQIQNDPTLGEAENLGRMAAAAVNRGPGSKEWRDFMTQFVDKDAEGNFNTAQLGRLLADDGTLGNADLDRKRAYLMSNRMCGAGSPGATGNGVAAIPLDFLVDSIDQALAPGCLAGGQPNPAGDGD